jgi:alkanesulfonate monooxygenase SsuD/methylene tetrahydromethanopterin reductase-like flavin-dependent oxidoreductase (luciferase family)
MATPRLEFGYYPPSGDRGFELIPEETFVPDLERVLDFASRYFSSFWVADHYMTNDRFRMECWTELTWIAARYATPRIGTLVMANNFRHPPLLAKMATSLQVFSTGRLILGYGAGWSEREYRAYGYDFPSPRQRIAQMVEGIETMRALWSGQRVSFQGQFYQLDDAVGTPRPTPTPPIMIGGSGETYLLRAVAKHADHWNASPSPIPVLRQKMAVLTEHCAAIGRDVTTLPKSVQLRVCLAATRAEAEQIAAAVTDLGGSYFVGEPAGLIDFLNDLADAGFDGVQIAFARFPETRDLELFVDKVLPAFR